jgi:hypothetical protein
MSAKSPMKMELAPGLHGRAPNTPVPIIKVGIAIPFLGKVLGDLAHLNQTRAAKPRKTVQTRPVAGSPETPVPTIEAIMSQVMGRSYILFLCG